MQRIVTLAERKTTEAARRQQAVAALMPVLKSAAFLVGSLAAEIDRFRRMIDP